MEVVVVSSTEQNGAVNVYLEDARVGVYETDDPQLLAEKLQEENQHLNVSYNGRYVNPSYNTDCGADCEDYRHCSCSD